MTADRVVAELKTRRKTCSDFRDDFPVPSNCSVCPIFGMGLPWAPFKLPYKAISSVWHHLRPFQRLKMIPGSVSIS